MTRRALGLSHQPYKNESTHMHHPLKKSSLATQSSRSPLEDAGPRTASINASARVEGVCTSPSDHWLPGVVSPLENIQTLASGVAKERQSLTKEMNPEYAQLQIMATTFLRQSKGEMLDTGMPSGSLASP